MDKNFKVTISYGAKEISYITEAVDEREVFEALEEESRLFDGWVIIELEHRQVYLKFESIDSIEIHDNNARERLNRLRDTIGDELNQLNT